MSEAPRWRLTNPHYLNIRELPDGTRVEWEHKETARATGRTVRKLFPVPMLLDPKEPADFNYPDEIIVAHEGEYNHPKDYIFFGSPTNEMEPLNESAEAITAVLRERWNNPVESLPANGGMTGAESAFMAKMMETFERIAPPHAATVVPPNEVSELKERLAKLEALLAAQAKPLEANGRRA